MLPLLIPLGIAVRVALQAVAAAAAGAVVCTAGQAIQREGFRRNEIHEYHSDHHSLNEKSSNDKKKKKKKKNVTVIILNEEIKSFMLYARDMEIAGAEDSRFWRWFPVEEKSRNVFVDVAELINAWSLDIKAEIDTADLTPGISYEVFIVLMMKDHAYGWENPVNLGLLLPNGNKKQHSKDLREIKQRNEWTNILVGDFKTSPENQGEMKISMCGSENSYWKKGLVIKGVLVSPKNFFKLEN